MVRMNVYVQAGLISLIILAGGMFSIKYMDDQRLKVISKDIESMKTEIEDSKLFILYSQTLGDNSTLLCHALKTQIDQRIEKNQQLIFNLQKYEAANVFGEEYYSLKTYFIVKNLELWLYFTKYKKLCDTQQVSILYFYPDKTACPECEVQANILTSLRNACKNVKVFALPANIDIGLINVLKDRYNVTKTPTIVVNEYAKFEGITTEYNLHTIIECSSS